MILGPRYKYEELTREEVLNLKDGDVAYIDSSYGKKGFVYPKFNETHRNMYWSQALSDLGYIKPEDGIKTVEMLRDWGPIYKKILIEEVW